MIDVLVSQLCEMLNAVGTVPCCIPKCKEFAKAVTIVVLGDTKIDALVPPEVGGAKQLISNFLWPVCGTRTAKGLD